jgi:hypothetical protein
VRSSSSAATLDLDRMSEYDLWKLAADALTAATNKSNTCG